MNSCSICFHSKKEISLLKWMRTSPFPFFICINCFQKCYFPSNIFSPQKEEKIQGIWNISYSSISLYSEEKEKKNIDEEYNRNHPMCSICHSKIFSKYSCSKNHMNKK